MRLFPILLSFLLAIPLLAAEEFDTPNTDEPDLSWIKGASSIITTGINETIDSDSMADVFDTDHGDVEIDDIRKVRHAGTMTEETSLTSEISIVPSYASTLNEVSVTPTLELYGSLPKSDLGQAYKLEESFVENEFSSISLADQRLEAPLAIESMDIGWSVRAEPTKAQKKKRYHRDILPVDTSKNQDN